MGGAVPKIDRFFEDIGASLEKAAKTTDNNLNHEIGKKQQKKTTNKNFQVNSGQATDLGGASHRFGGSTGTPDGRGGYFDTPAPPPAYSGPNIGGQLDLGRPGDPSNPLPATPLPQQALPWDTTPQGAAPENPPAWSATVPGYDAQVRRLKYRKYAKDRGL